jgi:hypothetical protein
MSDSRQNVLLYGDSLVLAGMQASLKTYPSLKVMCLNAQPGADAQALCALDPAVIIFDLAAVTPDFPFALLREQPHLLLIGIDPAGDKLLVLSGQQAHSFTTNDLLQVIETGLNLPQEVNLKEFSGHPSNYGTTQRPNYRTNKE